MIDLILKTVGIIIGFKLISQLWEIKGLLREIRDCERK